MDYTRDPGNRTQFVEKDGNGAVLGTTNATYSDDNRLLTNGNTSYAWDQNGNQTAKTTKNVTTTMALGSRTGDESVAIRLRFAKNKLTALTDGSTLSFAYNGDGLRQSKTVDGVTTRFVYSGMRLLQESNATGTTEVTYTLAPTGGDWHPLISDTRHPSLGTGHYAFDMLGTTRALTDANESVTATFTDDAYSNTLAATDPTTTPHQYVGRLGYYLDTASGLQLLTQRYYDAGVGRFVCEDPAPDQDGWYRYANAEPARLVDPRGLAPKNKGCSPAWEQKVDAVCQRLSKLTAAEWTAINKCIAREAAARKVTCAGKPPLGPRQQECMRQFCGGSGCVQCERQRKWLCDTTCYPKKPTPRNRPSCGHAPCKPGVQQPSKCITICVDSHAAGRCNEEPGHPDSWETIIHEMSHVCGRCHLTGNNPEDACSDIYSTCIIPQCM